MIYSDANSRLIYRRHRQMSGHDGGYGSLPIVSGIAISEIEDQIKKTEPFWRPVAIGVVTGVSMWLANRVLEGLFGGRRKTQ